MWQLVWYISTKFPKIYPPTDSGPHITVTKDMTQFDFLNMLHHVNDGLPRQPNDGKG